MPQVNCVVAPSRLPQKFSRLDIIGRGVLNTVINGNFASTSGWLNVGSGFAWSVSNNEAIITNLGSSASIWKLHRGSLPTVYGHKYYYAATLLSNSASDGISINGDTVVSHSGSGNYERLSVIGLVTTGAAPYALHTARTGDISANPVKVKDVILIDLTATFGVGSEPTKAQCDILFLNWFDGPRPIFDSDIYRRITNIVSNGNFANGTTGWISAPATLSAANNVLSVTSKGTSQYVTTDHVTTYNVAVGHKMYLSFKARVTNSDCVAIVAEMKGSITAGTYASYAVKTNPVQNQWYSASAVLTQAADFVGKLKISPYHRYADAATGNGKVMELKEVMVIDLTEMFGAGLEPTKAQCDALIPSWFDGTMTI